MRPKKPITVNQVNYEDIDEFIAVNFPMMCDMSEYFQYHPPRTEAREAMHELVAATSKMAFTDLVANNDR